MLFWSPVSQVYSPLSSMISLCMIRMWVVAFCSMVYFSPCVRRVEPFHQVTLWSGLDTSQDREASPPSLASWLFSSFLNTTGAAARDTNFITMTDFKTLESEHWHQKTHYNPQRGCTVLPKFTYNQSMCSKETYNPPIHKFKESHKYN